MLRKSRDAEPTGRTIGEANGRFPAANGIRAAGGSATELAFASPPQPTSAVARSEGLEPNLRVRSPALYPVELGAVIAGGVCNWPSVRYRPTAVTKARGFGPRAIAPGEHISLNQ